jgi:bifunctional non-homologous end joining protein LigD
MECQSVAKLPEGPQWLYEVKQDGYRAEAIIDGSTVTLYSIAGHGFNEKFLQIVESLKWLRLRSAVLDGELVALDENGRPSFNEIQNWKTTKSPIVYYVFDVLHLHGTDLLDRSLTERKQRLQEIAKSFSAPIILNQHFAVDLDSFIQQIQSLGLEGVVAKRANSLYHPGQKSDAWQKHHFKQQGKFVVGGYIPGPGGVGELLVGVDESNRKGFST